MNNLNKTYEELLQELQELKAENENLKIAYLNDISVIKNIEKKSREIDARYKTLFINAAEGILVSDLKTTQFVFANPSVCKMFGYSQDEFLQLKVSDIHPKEFLEQVISEFEKIAQKLKSNVFDIPCLRKDGSIFYVNINGSPIIFDEVEYNVGFFTEVTDMRIAIDALNKSEEKYRILFETLPLGVTLADESGKIIESNQSAERILGLSVEEHEQRTIDGVEWSIIRPDGTPMPAEEYASVRALKEQKAIFNVEMGVKKQRNEIAWINVNAAPVPGFGVVISFEDISERKKTEESIHQIRQNYETFFNTIDDFLFVLDEQGNIIHTNSTVTDRLGYTQEELMGQSVLMVHPIERREEAGRIVGEMLAGTAEFCPVPIVTKKGDYIPVETRVSPGIWDGKPVIFGVTKDISQVRLSEEKFSKLFKINPAACGLSDLNNHKYIEVNQAFYDLFGFDENEVIGSTASDLGILTSDAIQEILSNADSKGNVTNIEADLKAKNGDIKHVLLSSENIYVQDKQYRFTVVNDITERKKSERILRDSENKYRKIFDNIQDVFFQSDMEGTLIEISPSIERYTGFSRDFLIGKPVQNVYQNPDDRVKLLTVLQSKGEVVDFELYLTNNSGESVIASLNAHLLKDANDKIIGMEGSLRDISERKQAEEDQKKLIEELKDSRDVIEINLYQKNALIEELSETKDKLEQINSEKDKFFSIIAHDLKSPFSGFLGLTKMMADEIQNLTMREMQEFSTNLQQSANNLYKLLENLLDWSRMQRGLISFNPELCKLKWIVKQILDIQNESAKSKEILLNNNIPDEFEVNADIPMINTILRNLISNSLKFTPRGGRIEILTIDSSDEYAIICVKDSGIGMSNDTLSKLFKLDENVSHKGTEGEPSTGLGLLLSKDFVEKHGGKIWVESEEGKGSKFYFSLPKNNDK